MTRHRGGAGQHGKATTPFNSTQFRIQVLAFDTLTGAFYSHCSGTVLDLLLDWHAETSLAASIARKVSKVRQPPENE
jgi:hypothetical protein